MTTKIGLVSDVHSSPKPLAQALEIFHQAAVEKIICAGDIAGYYDDLPPTIDLLKRSQCQTIVGNHDQSYLAKSGTQHDHSIRSYLQQLPETLEFEIDDKRIFVVHANPPSQQHGGIKLLDPQGTLIAAQVTHWRKQLSIYDYDVLIVGHTHQVYAEQLGDIFVVNPGSSVFNHSCMVLTLPDMRVETFALEHKDIVYCWNFGMLRS